ncbi:MAG: dynamin family protein [Butyricicoccus sp.]
MNQQDVLSSSQILVFHPILKENNKVKIQYFCYLKKLIRLVKWDKRKYTRAQLNFYRRILYDEDSVSYIPKENIIPTCMCYLVPYDLAIILAYHQKVIHTEKIEIIINKIAADFNLPAQLADFLYREFDAALGDIKAWEEVLNNKAVDKYKRFLKMVKANILFVRQYPYRFLITATMSAGKSTLINSLVGKNISLMQNMACTSKVHNIVSKPFEDGVSSEYDYDLSLNASREDLLTDNGNNFSAKITVGTYFNSALAGRRVILLDSPGVNSSENEEHCKISQKIIRSRRYKLLLYVMNATQLATNDEYQHLEFVKKHIGRADILFVMNKIDSLNFEEENLTDIIQDQHRFLCDIGFREPIICPVSARAAYLVKKDQQTELARFERHELYNYMDKFEQNSIAEYYENILHCPSITDSDDEAELLLKNCGFAYLEEILASYSNGGKTNDTDLC